MAKMAKWRRHTVEFKRQVVERMKTCENIHALARELKLERKLLYTWKYQFEGRPEPRHANLGITAEDRKDKQLPEGNEGSTQPGHDRQPQASIAHHAGRQPAGDPLPQVHPHHGCPT